jgi:hypothetical protein
VALPCSVHSSAEAATPARIVDDIRRRNGIETTIGLRRLNFSLDLRNRRANPQHEGLPGNPLGAMNGIEQSP